MSKTSSAPPFRNFSPFHVAARPFGREEAINPDRLLGRRQPTMTHPELTLKPGQLTFTVQEAAAVLGISKSSAYEAARRGELPALRFGRRLVVTRTTLETLLGLFEQPARGQAENRKRPRRSHWLRLPDGVTTTKSDWKPGRFSSTA
jgi:excisionase family DNA binding protein